MHHSGQAALKVAMIAHKDDAISIANARHDSEMRSLRSKCDEDLSELQLRTDKIVFELGTRLKMAENERLKLFEKLKMSLTRNFTVSSSFLRKRKSRIFKH
jgi:hypothetical protein